MSSVFMGIALHAVGGVAAATCFLPQKGSQNWSYQTYWLLFCFFAWLVIPISVALLTVPDLAMVLKEAPTSAIINTSWMGAVYGFGGMAFAMAIRYIGFSLTYSIAIGISAVLGTVIPAAVAGTLIEGFSTSAGLLVLCGFVLSLIGVGFCGAAGLLKELELDSDGSEGTFDMKKGLVLAIVAGSLSGVFGMSLAAGSAIDERAAFHGATDFRGNATYIFAMGGAFLTNLVWWSIVHFKQGTWREYASIPNVGEEEHKKSSLPKYYFWGILAGALWYGQFFFYGLGHVRMGDFQFVSWGIHMAMLIFFSFGVGFVLKEWVGLSRKTMTTLYVGLAFLFVSFGIITYGSSVGV